MKILATDLDRTLLPNGSWPPDSGAIDLFNELTARHEVLVVYVTGRNLRLTEDAIEEYTRAIDALRTHASSFDMDVSRKAFNESSIERASNQVETADRPAP